MILYRGNNRVNTVRERVVAKGYATGFSELIQYVNDQLPSNELIGRALRQEKRMYPEVAVRELVANMLIHQDLALKGSNPMVEIFSDRIEITNPGIPVLYSYKPMKDMRKEDRVRACYQHACLCCVSNQEMTNASLRKRFGIDDQNAAIASRIIADTVNEGLIKSQDPTSTSRKHSRYMPFWAAYSATKSMS